MQSSFKLNPLVNDLVVDDDIFQRSYFFDHYSDKLTSDVKYIIGITHKRLDNNYFSDINETNQLAIISLYGWDIYSPPFKLTDYIKLEILESVLGMLCIANIGHYDTRGCLFDFCADKKDIIVKLHSGSICADCKARLMYHGMAEEIPSSLKILWNISKDYLSINVGKGCPIGHNVCRESQDIQRDHSDKNIFLAVSYGTEYNDLIDHLRVKFNNKGFNLKVGNDAIENRNILCKTCKAIKTCKFGIAEFSGFRHNVTYEFGLMQAFGLNTIGVIKEGKISEFRDKLSDMAGIEIIPYNSVSTDLFDKLMTFVTK
jgi:hypothetical protein